MYKSPIDIFYGQIETQIEGEIMKAVQKVHVNVDKDELLRALQYDREQYEKGYDDAIAELEAKSKWIPVTERLPEMDGTIVLVCGSRKGIYTAEFRRKYGRHWFHKMNSKNHHCEPTHWMPLPEAPKGE